MRVLIYEPLPDINRAPIIAQLARTLMGEGHEVLVLIEEKLIYTLLGKLTPQGVINCSRTWRRHIGIHAEIAIRRLKTPPGQYWFVNKENLKERLNQIAQLRQQQYEKILREFTPDRIFVWNGQHEHLQDFMKLCKNMLEGKFVYMECGWFPQKGTIYFDSEGVNAASSIANRQRSPLSDKQLQRLETWQKEYASTEAHDDIRGQIFVPLQVETDTNISLYSPFKTMQGFVDFLENWIPEGYDVILRPHPLSDPTTKISTQRKNFRIDSTTPIKELIWSSEVVVGINSTVLLEALAMKKSAIAFGDGFLKKTQLTQRFHNSTINTFYSESSTLYTLIFEKQDLAKSCLRSAELISGEASQE